MKKLFYIKNILLLMILIFLMASLPVKADDLIVNFDDISNYGVIAGNSIENLGAETTIMGNVAIAPGDLMTGITEEMLVNGEIQINNEKSIQAHNDLILTYNEIKEKDEALPINSEFGNQTIVSGIYCMDSPSTITGTLILDAQNDPDNVFIFQVNTIFSTESNSCIKLVNGAQSKNIFWQIEGDVTIGENSEFCGNIIGNRSITLGKSAQVNGGVYAIKEGIILNNNDINSIANDDDDINSIANDDDINSIANDDDINSIANDDDISSITNDDDVQIIESDLGSTEIIKMGVITDSLTSVTQNEIVPDIETKGDDYSATIEWGAMHFNYNFGTWDSENHQWVGEEIGWSQSYFDGINDKITVINESTQMIYVDFDYNPDDQFGGTTVGAFTKSTGNLYPFSETPSQEELASLTGTMNLLVPGEEDTYLNISGVPLSIGSTPMKIGNISINLNTEAH
jgi:hypothetical protein